MWSQKQPNVSVALYPAVLVLINHCDFSNLTTSKNLIISNVLYKHKHALTHCIHVHNAIKSTGNVSFLFTVMVQGSVLGIAKS